MIRFALLATALVLAALAASAGLARSEKEEKKMDDRVFELRIYHAAPGKMKALHARFRDHTCKLFQKHGMTLVGFWSPTDPQKAEEAMYYVLAYPNKAAADASWKAFRDDPDWKKAKADSEKDGSL